jgi:hypothetical protein
MSFVMVPSPYADIPQTLTSAVPKFARSDEYASLQGTADDLPGVVLAAFGSFLAHTALRSPSDQVLAKGLALFGDLWRSNDSQTRVSIEDEFFEALDLEPDAVAPIVDLMTPELRGAHSEWAARSF